MLNHLNDSDVSGNTIAHIYRESRENTASHTDQYECPCCQEIVQDHEFIHELKVCRQCFEDKHGARYVGIDQAEYLKGDR